jgi:hypothetical protein
MLSANLHTIHTCMHACMHTYIHTMACMHTYIHTCIQHTYTRIYTFTHTQVAKALIAGRKVEPETKECVSIFVSDIVGYTLLCQTMDAAEVSDMLDRY